MEVETEAPASVGGHGATLATLKLHVQQRRSAIGAWVASPSGVSLHARDEDALAGI